MSGTSPEGPLPVHLALTQHGVWDATAHPTTGELIAAIAGGSDCTTLHIVRGCGAVVASYRCPAPISRLVVRAVAALQQQVFIAAVGANGELYYLHDGGLRRVALGDAAAALACEEVRLLSIPGRVILRSGAAVIFADLLRPIPVPSASSSVPSPRALPPVLVPRMAADGDVLEAAVLWRCSGAFARVFAPAVADLNFATLGRGGHCSVFLNAAMFARDVPPGQLLTDDQVSVTPDSDQLTFMPAIPVKVPSGDVLDGSWQQLAFTSVLLLTVRRRKVDGGALTILQYSVTRVGNFGAAPSFQCLLTRATPFATATLAGHIPIATRTTQHAPTKIRMFALDNATNATLRLATTRFSRHSAPSPDRGYEVRASFPALWGAPVRAVALPVHRRRRTLLMPPPTGSDSEISSRVDLVMEFASGLVAHASFEPAHHRWTLEAIIALRCAREVVDVAAAFCQVPLAATLFADGTVMLHHTRAGTLLSLARADAPATAGGSEVAGAAEDQLRRVDDFISAKCPGTARHRDALLRALGGDAAKLLKQLEAKYGELTDAAVEPPSSRPAKSDAARELLHPRWVRFVAPSDAAAGAHLQLEILFAASSAPQRVAARRFICIDVAVHNEVARASEHVRGLYFADDGDERSLGVDDSRGWWAPALPSLYELRPLDAAPPAAPALGNSWVVADASSRALVQLQPLLVGVEGDALLLPSPSPTDDPIRIGWATLGIADEGQLAHLTAAVVDGAVMLAAVAHSGALHSTIVPRSGDVCALEVFVSLPRPATIVAVASTFLPAPCLAVAWPEEVRVLMPSAAAPLAWASFVCASVVGATVVRSISFAPSGALIVLLAAAAGGGRVYALRPGGTGGKEGDARGLRLEGPGAAAWCCEQVAGAGDVTMMRVLGDAGLATVRADSRVCVLPMALRPNREHVDCAPCTSTALKTYVEANAWECVSDAVTHLHRAICGAPAPAATAAATATAPTSAADWVRYSLKRVLEAPLSHVNAHAAATTIDAAIAAAEESPATVNLGPARRPSEPGSGDPALGTVAAVNVDELAAVMADLPRCTIAGFSPAEQMRLAVALQVVQQDVMPAAASGAADRAALPFVFSWRLHTLLERMRAPTGRIAGSVEGATAGAAAQMAPAVGPTVAWALLSETHDRLLELLCLAPASPSWEALRSGGAALWVRSPLALRRACEAVGKAVFSATRAPKSCALFYILAGKVGMLSALCKAVNNTKLEQFFARNFSIDKNRSAASANAYAAIGKGDVQYGAAFFILAGEVSTAASVLIQRAGDWQLAFLVLRLASPGGALTTAAVEELFAIAAGIPLTLPAGARCCMRWQCGEHVAAMQELWHVEDASFLEIVTHAAKHSTVLAMKSGAVLPLHVEAAMTASAARRAHEAGLSGLAQQRFQRLARCIAAAREAAAKGSTFTAGPAQPKREVAPAAVADFNSGQLALRMDSDSDDPDDGGAPTSGAACANDRTPSPQPSAEGANEGEGTPGTPSSQLLLWEHEMAMLGAPDEGPALMDLEAASVAALLAASSCREEINDLRQLGDDAAAEAAGRRWTLPLLDALHALLIARTTAASPGDPHTSTPTAVLYHTLATLAVAARHVPLAAALAEHPPLIDVADDGRRPSVPRCALEYCALVVEAATQSAAATITGWRDHRETSADHGAAQENLGPGGAAAAAAAASMCSLLLMALFDAAVSRTLRHAAVASRISDGAISTVLLTLATTAAFERTVDAVACTCDGWCPGGPSGGDGCRKRQLDAATNGSVVQQRRVWARLHSLLIDVAPAALPVSLNGRLARFFNRLVRVLCADALHSTIQLPGRPTLTGSTARAAFAELSETVITHNAAAKLSLLLAPSDGPAPLVEELEFHQNVHVATPSVVRHGLVREAAARSVLLQESRELCPRQRAVVHSCCIDLSSLDNVAISVGNTCHAFHGQRDALVGDEDDALLRLVHERNRAIAAFASDMDPSICCTVALEDHPARALVPHPHLPIFLSGGSTGALTLHQFGNPYATIRIRSDSHSGVLGEAAFSRDGFMYAAADSAGCVALWRCASDAKSVAPIAMLRCFDDARSLTFVGHRTTALAAVGLSSPHSDGRGGSGGSLRMIDALVNSAVGDTMLPAGFDPRFCGYVDEGDAVLVISRNGGALLYDVRASKFHSPFTLLPPELRPLATGRGALTCFGISRFTGMLAAGNASGDVLLWSLSDMPAETGAADTTVPPLGWVRGAHQNSRSTNSATTCVCFSPGALVSSGTDGAVIAMPLIPSFIPDAS